MLAFFGSVFIMQNTYADDVQVNFNIQNHQSEITAENAANNTELELGATIPITTVTYKNTVRVAYSLLKDDTIVKSDSATVELVNESRTISINLSDVELEVGDYTIKVTGYNVDENATAASDITFKVKEFVPNAPDTGSFTESAQEFTKASVVPIIITGVLALVIFIVTKKLMKGARR